MAKLGIHYFIFIWYYMIYVWDGCKSELPADAHRNSNTLLSPCRTCNVFVESLKEAVTRTEKNHYEGGDAAWEKDKLTKYENSEMRLTEIQEIVCSDIKENLIRAQCYALREEYENEIEEWWFKNRSSNWYQYFCIDQFKLCCPQFQYGVDCMWCSGYDPITNLLCNGNGKCRGDGTRIGDGKCNCENGYMGTTCNQCASGYYESFHDTETKRILCSKCHISCKELCTGPSPKGCIECKTGWILDMEKGCIDMNECTSIITTTSETNICGISEYCINTEGSYRCVNCDKACTKCYGDGPDMCTQCNQDYQMIDSVCVDKDQVYRSKYVLYTRYITYLGLCVATCIVLQKNTTAAGCIGIIVGIYITVSEYLLSSTTTTTTTGTV